MDTAMYSVIGKEWRERRMALLVCSGLMLCCVCYAVVYERVYQLRDPVATFEQASLMFMMFAAIFLAMKTALAEQTSGTMGFSLSLPISRRRLAWTRLAGGVLTLVLPVVIGAIVLTPILLSGVIEQVPVRPAVGYGGLPERPSLSAADAVGLLWTVTAVVVASGTQLLLILAVFGARRRAESHIGFFGAVLAFGWLILGGVRAQSEVVNGWLGALFPVSLIINYGYEAVGGGSYTDLDLGRPLWAPLAVNLVLLVLLAAWFVRRYGTPHRTVPSRWVPRWLRLPAFWSHIPVALPNQTAALVWINLRQSVPLAMCGLMLAALITFGQFTDDGQSFRTQLPTSTWFVATLWATVVAAGVLAAELQPGLSGFWRSRPITVGRWFWCKFFTGLFAVLVVLDGVTILVSWGTPIGYTTGLSLSYVACMPVLHATMYAMAVLGVCLTRRPVVGSMLAIAIFVVTLPLVASINGGAFEPIDVYNGLVGDEIDGQLNLSHHRYPLVYGTLVMVTIASAWWASRAIRHPQRLRLFSRRRKVGATI